MRKIVMIAILVVSMVQGVFAQQIIIKGTVKDATSMYVLQSMSKM